MPLVQYRDVRAGTGAPLTTEGGRGEFSLAVSVYTVFRDITPVEYVSEWGGPSGTQQATIRSHPAVRFEDGYGATAAVWEERPGALVIVGVPPEMAADLDGIAERVRAVDGPVDMPYMLKVPGTATLYAEGNGSAHVVAARIGGNWCVGVGFVQGCSANIDDISAVRAANGVSLASGATPADVATVRVVPSLGPPVERVPFEWGESGYRFYRVEVADDFIERVEWVDARGDVIASSASLDAFRLDGGERVHVLKIDDMAVGLRADVAPSRSLDAGGDLLCVFVHTVSHDNTGTVCQLSTIPNVVGEWNGVSFGSVGVDVAEVLLDGRPAELLTSPQIADRRFFVGRGDAVFLDASGVAINVPPPPATS